MSLVKVVPSNGVAEGYMDVPISSAPTGKLGLQMLPDEQVLWEGTFQAFAKVNLTPWERFLNKLRSCLCYKGKACCGCITLNKPTATWDRNVMLTNKRLVVQEKEDYAEPGQKFMCYYVLCCCMAEMNIKADTMEENFVQAVDIKDFHVDTFRSHTTATACFCCTETLEAVDTSKVVLHVVRPPGVSKASFGVWNLDKDLKTYTGQVEIEGRISREDLNDFAYALRRVVQNNVSTEKAYTGIAAVEKA